MYGVPKCNNVSIGNTTVLCLFVEFSFRTSKTALYLNCLKVLLACCRGVKEISYFFWHTQTANMPNGKGPLLIFIIRYSQKYIHLFISLSMNLLRFYFVFEISRGFEYLRKRFFRNLLGVWFLKKDESLIFFKNYLFML